MNSESPVQLTLGVQLRDEANFSNFFLSAENEALLGKLNSLRPDDHLIYLWGASGTGRSHLMQALCHQHADAGEAVLYLPLADKQDLHPDILSSTGSLALVCLDDIDTICGDQDWERAVFQLYNSLQETDTQLLVSADSAPQHLSVSLADLQSRLQSGLVFQLATVTDPEKSAILQLRARNRGMELAPQIADYIVQRADRNLNALMAVLDKLDQETLKRGRRLTIPLIKDVLGW